MRFPALPLPLLASAFALPACGQLFVVEVEEPDLCMILQEANFPGTSLDLHEKELAYDLTPALPEETGEAHVEMQVEMTSFSIRSRSGVEDLSFLDSAELLVLDGDEELRLASWKPEAHPGRVAAFAVREGVEMGHLVEERDLRFAVRISGSLPAEDWSADAEACFHVVSKIHYFE